MTDRMTISDVARELHCSTDTIRNYEREGIIPPVTRTHGGWRVFTSGDVERIARVLYQRPQRPAFAG